VWRVAPRIDATELPVGLGRVSVEAPWCQEPRIRPTEALPEAADALTGVSERR
jgi:hypothetical protein